ncbi:MAG TPA: hypothetical protein ENG74_01700 [Thermoplasmatales archaeon]|nr:hypothetical protein [Thermoplasmatales archaeon]
MDSLEEAKSKLNKAKSILATVSYVKVGDPITSSLHNKLVDISKQLSDAIDALAKAVEEMLLPPEKKYIFYQGIFAGKIKTIPLIQKWTMADVLGVSETGEEGVKLRGVWSGADVLGVSETGEEGVKLKEVWTMSNYIDIKETEEVIYEEKTQHEVVCRGVGKVLRDGYSQHTVVCKGVGRVLKDGYSQHTVLGKGDPLAT